MGNGKHVALFDMSILWDEVQRRDKDVRETAYIANFFNRVEGHRRIEDRFQNMILVKNKIELQIT